MKLLLFSFFLKREEEEDKEEEEETLEMIALPLCLLRFVRVRALVAVALVGGGIDDDDDNNIFISLLPLFCFCVTFWHAGKRDSFLRNTRSRPKFSFFVFFVSPLFALFSFVRAWVAHHLQSAFFLLRFPCSKSWSCFCFGEERRTLSLTA